MDATRESIYESIISDAEEDWDEDECGGWTDYDIGKIKEIAEQVYQFAHLSGREEQKRKPIEEISYLFTGNRFDQVLVFQSYGAAIDWCRKATTWDMDRIVNNVKVVKPNWQGHFDLFKPIEECA